MSSTSKTTNLELSQFIGTDKPTWLTDYNSDMSKIDIGYKEVKDAVESAQADVDAVKEDISSSVEQDITNIKTDIQTLGAADTAMSNRVVTLETNYDTIHHEIAVAQEDIVKNETDISALYTIYAVDVDVTEYGYLNSNFSMSATDINMSGFGGYQKTVIKEIAPGTIIAKIKNFNMGNNGTYRFTCFGNNGKFYQLTFNSNTGEFTYPSTSTESIPVNTYLLIEGYTNSKTLNEYIKSIATVVG